MGESAEDSPILDLDGALWVPFKELFRVVNCAIYKKDTSSIQELEVALRNHRLDFVRLLKNPSKKAESREVLKNATTDGIRILGQHGKRVFPKAVVDEALILSDLFDLNEIVALELLLLGESQQPRLAAATRGLAAVLLYYDSHRCLVNSLRALIQAREGRCWTLGLPREMTELITKYTDDLWEEGLYSGILTYLKSFDVDSERSRLENSRALGGPKHRKQVLDLIEEIRTSLAECIYCWSSQSGLKSSHVLQLLDVLSDVVPNRADGQLDNVQFTLLMSVLYAIDLGVLTSTEDSDELVQNFPLIADMDFVANVHKELLSQRPWKYPSMKAAIQFCWAVSLRTMSQLQSIQIGHRQQYTEEDETILDLALDGGAFNFLCTMIVCNKHFYSEEFFVRRIHGLITDFIVFCPLKVKELRNRGDEIARILSHGDQLPDTSVLPMLHFKHFLELVTTLYYKDPLGLLLNEEYWCADDFPGKLRMSSATFTNPTPKQVNLFKFLRLAGDLLPPLLYVPYIRMLSSLASSPTAAHHCFNLLKTNCSVSSSSHYGTISWDHFFGTLHRYFASFRQEAHISGLQQQRVVPRSITPQEVEGLCAVLRLILTVVEHDDVARIALCESSEWTPHTVLLGLLSCWIPLALKAQIVDTLAALVKSPEVAMTVWQLMESSRILPVQVDGSGSTMQMELEEVESHSEEYPLTRAMLQLLSVFVDTCHAIDISGSPAASRYDSCVVYVISCVLSKFHLRPYKAVEEKWKVANLSLEFLLKLVLRYNGMIDFKQPVRLELSSFPCGHTVMLNMLQDGLLLKAVLYIIDEVAKASDEHLSDYPGKEDMENSALNCLKLVQSVLEKQDTFVAFVRECRANILIVGLDQLLMGINPRTQRADYLIRIGKFVSYSDFLPEHAFYATSILLQMCRSSVTQDRLVGVFSMDKTEMANLSQGLVECLEVEDSEEETNGDGTGLDSAEEEGRLRSSTRRTILRMLIYCLRYPPPNLALFLLGFDFTKAPQRTVLQDPGVLGSTYTCFHAVLEILFRDSSTSELSLTSELCQQLVYTMCTQTETSAPTLRYLRTSHDFLYRQLKMIPFRAPASESQSLIEINLLNRQAWLLKTIAVELRVAAASGQRSNLQRLTALLIDDKNSAGSSRCKLLSILDDLELTHSFPEPMQWEFFDAAIIEQVISACERPTPSGCVAIDIRQLHHMLLTEINNLQGSMTLGQRPIIMKELHAILKYVNLRNRARLHLHSKRQVLEAWRLCTEMVLATWRSDFIDNHRQVTVILEIAHSFLQKVLRENSIHELVNPTACILPTLFLSLRQCFAVSCQPLQPSQQLSWKPYSSSLEVALHNLIECVLGAGVGPHKVRANYYCAFLNLLKVCSVEPALTSDLQSSDELESDKFMKKCMEIICIYGNSFVEIVCRDASNTNDISKMLAICCLSFVVANDRRQFLIHFMASNGYIQDFVNSLRADDRFLCTLPSISNAGLRKLYVYETKMAFFVQLSRSIQGAQQLLYCGFLTCLAEMQVFSMRPEHWNSTQTTEDNDGPWFDSKSNFHHILVPALHVCLCLLTSSSGSILDTHSQAVHFLVSHVDAFSAIMKECDSSANSLQELSLIIAVIAKVFALSDNAMSLSSTPAEVRTQLSRLHRLARNLLPLLVSMKKSKWSSHLVPPVESSETGGGSLETESYWEDSVVNLLFFYVNVAKGDASVATVPRLIFGPTLTGGGHSDMFSQEYSVSILNDTRRMPSLGLLVFLIQYSLHSFSSLLTSQQLHQTGRQQQLSLGMWAVEQPTEISLSTSDLRKEARRLDSVINILEHSLYLLWFHLEFYLVKSTGRETRFAQPSTRRHADIRHLHDLSRSEMREDVDEEEWGSEVDMPFLLSQNELENLKASLLPELSQSVLNEGLLDKTSIVIQYLEKMKRNQLLSVIVRRLRWLVSNAVQ